jgi:hypothetical protein
VHVKFKYNLGLIISYFRTLTFCTTTWSRVSRYRKATLLSGGKDEASSDLIIGDGTDGTMTASYLNTGDVPLLSVIGIR